MSGERSTALLIPCPWSGDDNDPIPRSYWWWYRLYRSSRVARHKLGMHDWRGTPSPSRRYCTWCGARREVSS